MCSKHDLSFRCKTFSYDILQYLIEVLLPDKGQILIVFSIPSNMWLFNTHHYFYFLNGLVWKDKEIGVQKELIWSNGEKYAQVKIFSTDIIILY